MYEFWYDYVKRKYGENAKLSDLDTDSFIVHIKTDDLQRQCKRCWKKIWHI